MDMENERAFVNVGSDQEPVLVNIDDIATVHDTGGTDPDVLIRSRQEKTSAIYPVTDEFSAETAVARLRAAGIPMVAYPVGSRHKRESTSFLYVNPAVIQFLAARDRPEKDGTIETLLTLGMDGYSRRVKSEGLSAAEEEKFIYDLLAARPDLAVIRNERDWAYDYRLLFDPKKVSQVIGYGPQQATVTFGNGYDMRFVFNRAGTLQKTVEGLLKEDPALSVLNDVNPDKAQDMARSQAIEIFEKERRRDEDGCADLIRAFATAANLDEFRGALFPRLVRFEDVGSFHVRGDMKGWTMYPGHSMRPHDSRTVDFSTVEDMQDALKHYEETVRSRGREPAQRHYPRRQLPPGPEQS